MKIMDFFNLLYKGDFIPSMQEITGIRNFVPQSNKVTLKVSKSSMDCDCDCWECNCNCDCNCDCDN